MLIQDCRLCDVLKARKTAHIHSSSMMVLGGHNDGHFSIISWGRRGDSEVGLK